MTERIEKLLYSREEAAEALSISCSTLDVLIKNRKLAVRRVGRLIRIPRSELLRLSRMDMTEIWPTKVDGRTTRKAS